jgi:hypothetical protein
LIASETATREQIELLREQLGFNRPVLVQLFDYYANLLRGDGASYCTGGLYTVDGGYTLGCRDTRSASRVRNRGDIHEHQRA